MDDRLKLATFVIAMFTVIWITDYLDKSLTFLTTESDWWSLAVGSPFLMVTVGTGLLVLQIKSLIKFAFFGAICLFILLRPKSTIFRLKINLSGMFYQRVGLKSECISV